MKTIEDCRVWTMERADGSWACTIESPTQPHISILDIGASTEEEAIERCKVKWHNKYDGK